jgi:RNA polymerase sigma-70 factor, ECF subfamily
MSITPLRPRAGANSPDGPSVRLVTPGVQDAARMLDDNALFRTVVMPYIDEAYRLARWLTANGADAEDVVQDASLRAFRAIRSYAGGNPRAWLLSIVRNTAYSWLRKNRPATIVSVDDLEAVELEHGKLDERHDETPESSLIAKVDAEQLRGAIANLPAAFRETLVLRDIEGLDYREIAEATEVPIGTVMSRLARARRRLLEMLRQND